MGGLARDASLALLRSRDEKMDRSCMESAIANALPIDFFYSITRRERKSRFSHCGARALARTRSLARPSVTARRAPRLIVPIFSFSVITTERDSALRNPTMVASRRDAQAPIRFADKANAPRARVIAIAPPPPPPPPSFNPPPPPNKRAESARARVNRRTRARAGRRVPACPGNYLRIVRTLISAEDQFLPDARVSKAARSAVAHGHCAIAH